MREGETMEQGGGETAAETAVRTPPEWVAHLAIPVWISSLDHRVSYLNPPAEKLLGITSRDARGRFCDEVVAAEDTSLRPFCARKCPVTLAVEEGRKLEPLELRIPGANGHEHWVQILVLPVRAVPENETSLVHCAIDAGRSHRITEYLHRLASRTSHARPGSPPTDRLTRREKEVLQLLAEDDNLMAIAERLHLSYFTVRNHVQHLLAKLGAHSVMEAVALYLLTDDEEA
jgi:DNA-binding CsgD family transcriptional regulator